MKRWLVAALVLLAPVAAHAQSGVLSGGSVTATGGTTAHSLAEVTSWGGLYPYSFGAKCDGTTDDNPSSSGPLQQWLNAGSSGVKLALPNAICAFSTALSAGATNNLSIHGNGPGSLLLYTGANTTTDLLTLGSLATSSQNITLEGFRVASNTVMTGGAAVHIINAIGGSVSGVNISGQANLGATGSLYNGIYFDRIDHMRLLNFDLRATNELLQIDGSSGLPQADLFVSGGKIGGGAVGIHLGGGFGGLYIENTDVIGNNVELLIDNALVSEANREVFLSPTAALDSTQIAMSGSDVIKVNDTLASGGVLNFCGWVATGARYGVNIISWPSGTVSFCGGPVYNNSSDGIHVADTSVSMNISPGVQIHANGGYGINATATINVQGTYASLFGNTSGATNNVTMQLTNRMNQGLNGFPDLSTFTTHAGATSGYQVFNNSASSNTTAQVEVSTGTANANTFLKQTDGATPIGSLATGSGDTGGLQVSTAAGPINLTPAGNLQVNGTNLHGLVGVQTFCAGGAGCSTNGTSGTFTPDAGTQYVVVEVQGPGGGSGGTAATSTGQFAVSASGSSGSYAKALITSGFSGVTVTTPVGGAAGASGNNTGGATSAASFGSAISCPGGTSGAGGAATTFSSAITTPQTNGTSACTLTGVTQILSLTGKGTDAGLVLGSAANQQIGSPGTSSPLGQGGRSNATATLTSGTAGAGFGSGASSAIATASQSAQTGSSGAESIVIVWEYY